MTRLPDSRLCPAFSRPTWFNSGQSRWSGCGSDVMLWGRDWLFTNNTRVPGGTVSCLGLTMPLVEIVIVKGLLGLFGVDDGESSHAAQHTRRAATIVRDRIG